MPSPQSLTSYWTVVSGCPSLIGVKGATPPCNANSLLMVDPIRVNKRFQDRLALRQTPNRLRSAVTKELYNTVFEHPAFGKLHMLAPGDAAEGKPATVRTAMRNISKARLYGPAFPGEPDILAVFETQQLEVTYTALCRTVDGSYWAQHHLIHKSGDCEDLIDATEMVSRPGCRLWRPADDRMAGPVRFDRPAGSVRVWR